jgi:cysteinyl-tRNA synthetase
MVEIRLRNSMTRKVERLEPIDPDGNVRMYVCGPTVYDRAHLGNARPVVVFDVLYRLLRTSTGPTTSPMCATSPMWRTRSSTARRAAGSRSTS